MKQWILGGAAMMAGAVAVGAISPPQAHAVPGLAVGACVVADKYHPGRITSVLPYGYTVQGPGNSTSMMWPFADVVPGPCPDEPAQATPARGAAFQAAPRPGAGFAQPAAAPRGGQCFPNDPAGGAGMNGSVRSVLIRGFSHQPNPGEDGRITVHLLSVRTGASHRAEPIDQVQYQTRPGAMITDVRASFQTCTDYNRRLVYTQRERNFVCFTKASGVFDCSMTANSPGLAQDSTREVLK